jgi:ADP-heptose:LPS heptosyltransferase
MPKILVIRNDKLGDFMLAWPALSLLKQQYPDSTVTVLIPSYTKPVAELCPWIDEIIIDDKHDSSIADALYLAALIKQHNIDASISLFSEMRTALALCLASVPQRFCTATKLAQLFINRKLRQKRSTSSKPEHEYNSDLARYFICSQGDDPVDIQKPPYLKFSSGEIDTLRKAYKDEHDIEPDRKIILIHAGTGGSAINLSLQQFAELARAIAKHSKVHFVLTAGPDELDTASALSGLMQGISHSIYHSTQGLVSFTRFIAISDLFISGSTGPLHIAGTLNVATAAFYPARRSATSLRWQTLNDENRRLAFMPERYTGEKDMQTIDIEKCASEINALLLKLYK